MQRMNRSNKLEQENDELRDRLSKLSEASLRINESIDLDEVLQGVLDSARSLTGARYGVITLLDDSAWVQDFLPSGMTQDEARRIWDTPHGIRIFEYLSSLSEPLRVPDILSLLRSLELPEFPPPVSVGSVVSFMAAPVLHRGERVANVFVADKETGSEFTSQDEETLVMFASQAALVIANARRYREEMRARKDLETLINISPVGVVVFDARSGSPVSFNREAGRIVSRLRDTDQSPEHLLQVVTVRRGDGREVSLSELPLAQLLGSAETVRAEEIVMRSPDGRSITVLINATPIHTEEGEVESLIVTLQDMSTLEEQERLRAEFLAMVSHELRMPLTSIKGSAATVLSGTAPMEREEIVQFFRIVDLQANHMHDLIGGLLDMARIETGALSISPEPTELEELVQEAKKAFASGGGRNSLEIDLPADLPWVMADRGRVVQVLGNLFSNAARLSPADSPIRVSAASEGLHVAISVSDEGMGVSAELLPHLFKKFSRTGSADWGYRGTGSALGLAICRGIVEAHGGRIRAESDGPGLGTRFIFTLQAVEVGAAVELSPPTFQLRPSSPERVPILAVDDDPQTLRHVRDALSRAGYSPIVTGDPGEVPRLMVQHKPQLVLLDMLLPGSDGIKVMNTILKSADVPVIFLSMHSDEDVVASAFDMGAVDYVVKPFSPMELAARIRSALRRRTTHGWASLPPYSIGELNIDYGERRVTLAGDQVQLTATEYEVLHHLSTAAGRVVTHDQLLQWVWGAERKGEPWLVRNVVKRLRHKLGDDASNPAYILTEPRVGYRMVKSEPRDEPA